MTSIPSAAIIIIGNEILSGRTRDLNAHYLAIELTKAGIDLMEIRAVADRRADIIRAVNALRARYSYIFTSGGIGPTHDDITASSIAAAFDRPISINPQARACLEAYYAPNLDMLNAARLRMARIPEGARLIPNKISGAPGFIIENVYVLAGIPKIFQAMVQEVLPNLQTASPILSKTIKVMRGEGSIAALLIEIERAFAGVSIGSYPFETVPLEPESAEIAAVETATLTASAAPQARVQPERYGTNVVLRSRDRAQLAAAVAMLQENVNVKG